MEKQPHRACERTELRQKRNQVTSHSIQLTTRSIVRFSTQTMQWYY